MDLKNIDKSNFSLVEVESFENPGGWIIDQQFMDQMGSPILTAHGLGEPVADARTSIELSQAGQYQVWIRTRNWAAPWTEADPPGKFKLHLNGAPLGAIFGTEGREWHWQDGGVVQLDAGPLQMKLHDLTGFDGRCDAVLLCRDLEFIPPEDPDALEEFRKLLSGLPDPPPDAGNYDLIVSGAGIAGMCAAISAARHGLKVALIHDRPVPGGNNSEEVRVHTTGEINQEPFPKLGNIVKTIVSHLVGNAQDGSKYENAKKVAAIKAEENIDFHFNMHVTSAEMEGRKIKSVTAQNIKTGERLQYSAPLYVDCTGDGAVGYPAGADFRIGREGRDETGESMAQEHGDTVTLGSSVMWYAVESQESCPFPVTPWAIQFNAQTCQKQLRGAWNWETGMNHDQIGQFEYIRDYGLRAAYGNWSFLKNDESTRELFESQKLEWVSCIAGKRESRRLLGDVILQQQDIQEQRPYADACVTTTWSIDLHYPVKIPGFDEEPFLTQCVQPEIEPYPIPYRCLFSRNIENLFMAGRNISATHVAFGSTRVMTTCGMMGEVIGMAASICRDRDTTPRGIYERYWNELEALMR